MNFFKIHENSKVGYKKLSDADLGIGISHQTHIGLHETSLDYLQNFARNSISPFIYKDSSKELLCLLTAIKRADGTIEAPKIISGHKQDLIYDGNKINSITKEVREIVVREGIELNWYLMWFGLDNGDLVFFLFNNELKDFEEVSLIVGSLGKRGTLNKEDRQFNQIIAFLENKLNKTSVPYLQELEIIAQTDAIVTKIIKPRFYDIEKAKDLFQKTGNKSEKVFRLGFPTDNSSSENLSCQAKILSLTYQVFIINW